MYQLHADGPAQEELEDESIAAANHWLLPATDFDGLWDSLVYDSSIKGQVGNVFYLDRCVSQVCCRCVSVAACDSGD